jgi:hypothetical protein
MTFLKWLDNHKTKLSGILLLTVSSLQANSVVVEQLLTPKQFALFTLVAGIVVTIIGSTNTARQKKPPPK